MIYVEDKRLYLPGGRTLAYADNGNTSSSTIVLFFHGAFAVGDASRLSPSLLEKNVHFIAPSLPGWGRSSPVGSPSTYATTLAIDIAALITHLHPHKSKIKLYICGHSFGTIPAQILYGASTEIFPHRRQIAGLVLLSPYSPPHCHQDYAKSMTWQNYIMTGPPARYIPFNLISRLATLYIARRMHSDNSAEAYVRKALFDTMGEEERETFSRWRDAHGLEEGQFEREMGRNVSRSVAHTWQGFLDIPAIYHSGWGGICPDGVANGHLTPPVLIVTFGGDQSVPGAMAEWLMMAYPSAKMKALDGSHVSAFFHLNEIWKEFLG